MATRRFLTWPYQAGGTTNRLTTDRAFDPPISVNEFYPSTKLGAPYTATFGTGGTLANHTSNPITNYYASLAAAQTDYPFLTSGDFSLPVETDWCAIQSALLYLYNISPGFGAGTLQFNGQYMVNKTIVCNLAAIYMVGSSFWNDQNNYTTSITYNGASGSVDAPVWILNCWTYNQTLGTGYATQLGSSTPSTVQFGPRVYIQHILFMGKNGSMSGLVGNESGYVSGISIGLAEYAQVDRCVFSRCLWDGINYTDAQIFALVTDCKFSGVYRDAISAFALLVSNSTTIWITRNEFSYVNRYSINLNIAGAIGAAPVVRNNSFEGQLSTNYFVANPSWFVHGIPATCFFLNCSQMGFADNYLEIPTNWIAQFHFVNSPGLEFATRNSSGANGTVIATVNQGTPQATSCTIASGVVTIGGSITGTFTNGQSLLGAGIPAGTYIVSGAPSGPWTTNNAGLNIASPITITGSATTPSALSYRATNGYWDITNTRNYLCGTASNSEGSQVQLRGNFEGVGNLLTAGGIGFSTAQPNTLNLCNTAFYDWTGVGGV